MKPANQNPARIALTRAVNDAREKGGPVFEEIAPPPDQALIQYEKDLKTLDRFGFVMATRRDFDAKAPQAARKGIKETAGAWGVYDPSSDSEGWALVGDNPHAIARETVRDLEYCESVNAESRLEYLRAQLDAESISYEELAELQTLAPYIKPEDVQLREAAGLPEHETPAAPVTIDLTPTWAETAQMVARLLTNGDATGQRAALDTLKQMGAICDAYRDLMKERG